MERHTEADHTPKVQSAFHFRTKSTNQSVFLYPARAANSMVPLGWITAFKNSSRQIEVRHG